MFLKMNSNSIFRKIEKIQKNLMLQIIYQSLQMVSYFIYIISFITLVSYFPNGKFMTYLRTVGIQSFFNIIVTILVCITIIYLVYLIASRYIEAKGFKGCCLGIVAAISFIIISPQIILGMLPSITFQIGARYIDNISAHYTILNYLNLAIVMAVVIAKGTVWYLQKKECVDKKKYLNSIVVILLIVIFIRVFFYLSEFHTLAYFIKYIFTVCFNKIGVSVFGMIAFYFFVNVFWFLGIHPNLMFAIVLPSWAVMINKNIEAYVIGNTLPYEAVALIGLFMYVGNTGNVLGLIINLLFCKSQELKKIGKWNLLLTIFNISDPIFFRAPIILKPMYGIPLMLSSCITGIISYTLLILFPISYNPLADALPWTTPFLLRAWVGGGVKLCILTMIICLVNIGIYYPFCKRIDTIKHKEEVAS